MGGISVDTQGHIWVIHRPWTVTGRELGAVEGAAACCRPAPSVIEFDQAGNVVQAWPELQQFAAAPGTPAGHPTAQDSKNKFWILFVKFLIFC